MKGAACTANGVSFALLCATFFASILAADAEGPGIRSAEVVGAEFRITLDDGHLLSQDELIGVVLLVGADSRDSRPLRIDGVLRDPGDPAGEIMLYALSAPDASGVWQNNCVCR